MRNNYGSAASKVLSSSCCELASQKIFHLGDMVGVDFLRAYNSTQNPSTEVDHIRNAQHKVNLVEDKGVSTRDKYL